MTDIAIRAHNLSKCYQIYGAPRDRLNAQGWQANVGLKEGLTNAYSDFKPQSQHD